MPRLEGRHVLVSGAGTGIGKAIAVRLAAEGARLSLLARNVERLRETAEAVGGAEVRACDIRKRAEVQATIADLAAAQGPFHAVVANSGIGGPNEPGPEDRFDDLVATNVTGTYDTLRAVESHLAPDGFRSLVVISSILARIGVPGYTGYCASKAALTGLVRALAMEHAAAGVQVNAICPGWVDTDMAHAGLEGMAAGMGIAKDEALRIAMQAVPLGKMGQPKDVAGMVTWLLTEDSRGVTGQCLDMNGGAFMI
ncbi:MAG: SDR family NAD(P)-dependent oxidoreductase [Planctomycetota bacterium]|nr:SDR family NAD(P)-dependent oxidoreductase [Planctomycetota bacterium]